MISTCFSLGYLDIYQNTEEILHKNVSDHFEITFSKISRKSSVSEKKVRSSPTHTARFGGVPNRTSWEQVLEKTKKYIL